MLENIHLKDVKKKGWECHKFKECNWKGGGCAYGTAGPGSHRLPRRRVPSSMINKASKCVLMTWRAISATRLKRGFVMCVDDVAGNIHHRAEQGVHNVCG